MATNVFMDSGAGAQQAGLFYAHAGTDRGLGFRLRREQGFVSRAGELHVETRSGLAGARGLAMAMAMEVLTLSFVWMAWHLLH